MGTRADFVSWFRGEGIKGDISKRDGPVKHSRVDFLL
jgi:hypothetical protein